MKAAVYVRISRDAEGRELGVRRQEDDCRARAKRLKWNVVEVFRDNDISANGKKRRPGWESMMDSIEDGRVNAVVAYSSSRLYRNLRDLTDLINLADSGAVQIATVVSRDIDLSTADGRMTARILASVDQREWEATSERRKRQIKQAQKMGTWIGGRLPFGYRPDDGKLVVYAPEAELIRQAAVGVLNGQSLNSIARSWNEKGFTTTGGKRWRGNHLRMVLQRSNPRILTDSDTRRLRKMFADPKRVTSPKSSKYLLTGLLTCGKCGGQMVGRPNQRGRRYACIAEGPLHLTIPAWPLELHVVKQAVKMRPTKLQGVQDPQEPLVAEQEEIKAKLRDLGKKIADGDDFAESAAEQLRERLTEIEVQLAEPPTAEIDIEKGVRALEQTLGERLQVVEKKPQDQGWPNAGHDALLAAASLATGQTTRASLEQLVDTITIAPGRAPVEDRASITWRSGVTRG